MQLTELVLKNYGKFTEKKIELYDGINLIYGENESGKSTIHTFIRGMLFGMERGRGRRSWNDSYLLYEPWENPNYYAGILRFQIGERNFRLERHFDKYAKKADLFCEDDGEELSVENGDLEMLLEGMEEADYNNTCSIGQLKVEADESLAEGLRNYAANCYTAGNAELQLEKAVRHLRDQKKQVDKRIREKELESQNKREQIEMEASYIWREIKSLETELKRAEEEEQRLQKKWEMEKGKEESHLGFFEKWRLHPVEIFSMIAAIGLSFFTFDRPLNCLMAVVVALGSGMYVWNCLKDDRKKHKVKQKKKEEKYHELGEELRKLRWKREKLQDDHQEKYTQYQNVQEKAEELSENDQEYQMLQERKRALELSENMLLSLAKEMQSEVGEKINQRISEILSDITNGTYDKVWMDADLHMNLLSKGKKISMEQVSRGTIEQIYFALRMTAAEFLYEEEYPVILDDTFVYYDELRLEAVLRWLWKNKKQVLLFTCQSREEMILKQNKIPYQKIMVSKN